jgi:hypothetical protein
MAGIERAAAEARKAGASFLVVYYVGHGGALRSSEQWLFLGGFTDALAGTIAGPADLEDSEAAPPDYLLPLGKLYDAVSGSGLPFALLVDACFDHEGFSDRIQLLDALKPAAEPDDFGEQITSFTLGLQEQLIHLKLIQDYGFHRYPYLSARNPVILASAPGFPAKPLFVGKKEDGIRLGPLAFGLVTERTLKESDRAATSLPALLRSLATDRYAEPETRNHTVPNSTISWSNFASFVDYAREIQKRSGGR